MKRKLKLLTLIFTTFLFLTGCKSSGVITPDDPNYKFKYDSEELSNTEENDSTNKNNNDATQIITKSDSEEFSFNEGDGGQYNKLEDVPEIKISNNISNHSKEISKGYLKILKLISTYNNLCNNGEKYEQILQYDCENLDVNLLNCLYVDKNDNPIRDQQTSYCVLINYYWDRINKNEKSFDFISYMQKHTNNEILNAHCVHTDEIDPNNTTLLQAIRLCRTLSDAKTIEPAEYIKTSEYKTTNGIKSSYIIKFNVDGHGGWNAIFDSNNNLINIILDYNIKSNKIYTTFDNSYINELLES